MSYIETLNLVKKVRRESAYALADSVRLAGVRLVEIEEALQSWITKFHGEQHGFRIAEWYEVDLPLPRKNETAVGFKGPFLNRCRRNYGSVTKKRISNENEIRGICGKEFLELRSEYSRLTVKLGAVASILDIRCSPDLAGVPKKEKRCCYVLNRNDRIAELVGAIRDLEGALVEIDGHAEEMIFEFNAIEGGRKRYGSLLARWELPSRIPAKTLSGPSGPAVFFVSFNRTKRMTSPISELYERVHQRKPKGVCPLTKPMIQKSRLGKYHRRYREAYRNLLSVRSQRIELIQVLENIDKYVR